jgi:hypothetical protein
MSPKIYFTLYKWDPFGTYESRKRMGKETTFHCLKENPSIKQNISNVSI